MSVALRYTATTTTGKSTALTYEELNQNFKEFMSLTSTGSGLYTLTGLNSPSLGVGTTNSGTAGEIRATGTITAGYSDERLKNLYGTIPNALDRILQLNGYYFTENQTAKDLGYSNDRMQVGLSAQEVERILPEVITDAPIENDQGYKTIWYDKMVPLLVEAIKEQQTIINDQKSQLEEQNTRLSILETQLETLLNKL